MLASKHQSLLVLSLVLLVATGNQACESESGSTQEEDPKPEIERLLQVLKPKIEKKFEVKIDDFEVLYYTLERNYSELLFSVQARINKNHKPANIYLEFSQPFKVGAEPKLTKATINRLV